MRPKNDCSEKCTEVIVEQTTSRLNNDEENDRLIGTSKIKLLDTKVRNFFSDSEINYFRFPIFIFGVVISLILFYYLSDDHLRDLMVWKPVTWSSRIWSLISYGFMHGDYKHLFYNTSIAILVGWHVECEQGWRVGLVWMLGLLGGSLGGGLFQPECNVVGSSAAVFAIFTSNISSVSYLYSKLCPWWSILRISIVVVFSICEVYRSLLINNDNIAWSSHLYGAGIGVIAGFAVYSTADKRTIYRLCRVISAVALVLILTITSIIFQYNIKSLMPQV